ncbi:MAG: PAS domain S-box protein, partial [Alphaproteobacteria bacterium]|nr:PAS domain S-box protein [Alphaproteobacteria bacterium]
MREAEPASNDLRRLAPFVLAGAAALALASAALSFAVAGPVITTLLVAGFAIVTAIVAARLVRVSMALSDRERAASEARFRVAVGNMGEGLVLWDRDGRILLWNERLLELLPHVSPYMRVGATLDEVNDAAIRALHPDWSDARIRERMDRRARAQTEPGTVHTLERPDGGIVELVSRRTPGGGLVTIYRDVTEAHRAARDTARSEARFRDGIQCMADGFVMWDAEDRLVTWNERHLELLPYLRPFLKLGAGRRDIVVAAVAA